MIIMHYYERNAINGMPHDPVGADLVMRRFAGRRNMRMRYEKGHKETTRAHILDVASQQFRESGVAAVGLAGIMEAAGLTNGAFYTHFDSKEDLVRAVLDEALSRREEKHHANLEAKSGLEPTIRD